MDFLGIFLRFCWILLNFVGFFGISRIIFLNSVRNFQSNLPLAGNKGCGGGWYWQAWKYFKDVGGADSEHSYPYEAKQAECRFKKDAITAQVASYVDLPSEDENALKEAVATVGPVSVAISVVGSLHRYKSGVYYERSCRKVRVRDFLRQQ